MKIRSITEDEALAFCSREETHFFDRKSIDISGQKVQKIAVALANADGGEFLIGLKDDDDEPDPNLRWSGALKIEDLNSHLQNIFNIKPSLDVKIEILECAVKHGYVLRVLIEKGSVIHKTTSGKIYQRFGAQSLPLQDPQQILELSYAKGATSFEDQIIKGIPPEAIVDSQELRSFLKNYSPATHPLDFATNQNLLDSRTWEPRSAGLLLFNENPSAVLPRKCAVKVTRYETKELEPERDHLTIQHTVEGPIYQQIVNTIGLITSIMSSVQIETADGLRNVEYPPEAIWEVVVNAIIHRDYSISDDIQILIFNDRIEILSPGRLPGYVTVENILDARFSRNTKVVRTLNRYPDSPNKDMGEGLNTTFQKMMEWGLESPIISEEGNYVKVILPHTPLASPIEAILDFLKKNPMITNKETRSITGIRSENLVKREFYKLRDLGFLERVPGLKGPKSAWQLTVAGQKKVDES